MAKLGAIGLNDRQKDLDSISRRTNEKLEVSTGKEPCVLTWKAEEENGSQGS